MIQVNYDREWCADKGVATIKLPGSKSMVARNLILDYIRGENRDYTVFTTCEDTLQLQAALSGLREKIPNLPEYLCALKVARKEGGNLDKVVFNDGFELGNGGTSLRFFIALVASVPGFEGEVRCGRQLAMRPLKPLIDALRKLGADIEYLEKEGYPPLYIKGKELIGDSLEIDNKASSQFVSALLLVKSLWNGDAVLNPEARNSLPYIEMTRKMIDDYVDIEADWSAAAFIYEVALLKMGLGGEIRISGLTDPNLSVQGDSRCASIFSSFGVNTEFCEDGSAIISVDCGVVEALVVSKAMVELDTGDVPDLVPAVAVALALSGIKYRLTGIGSLKYKESDRLSSIKTELEKVGISVEVGEDSLEWSGRRYPVAENEVIESWGDHRIAMAFAPAAIKTGYITIRGEECVSKSFPDYFYQLERLGFSIRKINGSNSFSFGR